MPDEKAEGEAGRETMRLFDLLFKYTLKEATPQAVIHFINGLFGKSHSPESAVTFLSTESVKGRSGKLENIISDVVLAVERDAYLLEAQIDEDKAMALRVFQYGFAVAREGRLVAEDGSRITVRMPEARVIYWENAGKTLEAVVLRLEFPGKDYYDYKIGTFKVLDRSVGELEERKMALLLPFYLLKFRKELKKSGCDSEKRKEIAGRLEKLSPELEAAVERSRTHGYISGEDGIMILENLMRMHRELYGGYAEFKEAYMKLEERLRPRWKEYRNEGLKEGRKEGLNEGRREGLKEGLNEGLKEGRKQALALFEQGWTLEQIKAKFDQEQAGEQADNTAKVENRYQ